MGSRQFQRVRSNRRDGFVLIVVLSTVLLLSILLFSFSHTTRMDLSKAETLRCSEQAMNCARAGLSIAIATIRDTNDIYSEPRLAALRSNGQVFSIADRTCSVRMSEETGRLNVNALKRNDGSLDRARIDQLLRLIDLVNREAHDANRIGYGIVPAIIDWIDRDNEVTYLPFVKPDGAGAEDSYYASLSLPYRCRNAPMATLDELLWIKGGSSQALDRLREVLTTTGSDRININAAPRLVIESLSEQMDPALARMIVQQRQLRPFRTIAELKDVPGMPDNVYLAIRNLITVSPSQRYYRVYSQATLGQCARRIEAVLRRNTQAGNVDIVLYRES
jgi:general secretion pathway protein K